MKTDRVEISKTIRRALKRSFPQASNIAIETIRPIKTAMTWKSVVLSVRCSITTRGQKQTIELFGGWDKEHPVSKKRAHTVLHFLWNHGFSKPPLLVPQPLLFDNKTSLLLYVSYQGETLYQLLQKKKIVRLGSLMALMGTWTADLHRLPAPAGIPKIQNSDDRLQNLRNAATFDGRGNAFFKSKKISRPTGLSRDLFHKRSSIRKHLKKLSLVHNDLHIRNILTNKKQDEVAVIDFNESRHHDPLDDVATFLVHLDVELRRFFPKQKVRRFQKLFLQSYQRRQKMTFSADERARLAIHAAWTGLRFLQYTLESNPPFPHRHVLNKPLCKIEERFWSIAQNPEHFLLELL